MTTFGNNPNPGNALDANGNPIFHGPMQENHTVPREIRTGAAYRDAARYLGYVGFDYEDADRNSNWLR